MTAQVSDVYNSLKNLISKAIESEILNRAYVFILKGAHYSGKSYILEKLTSDFKEKMITLNFNIFYTNHSVESKRQHELIQHPLKFIRDTIEANSKTHDIIALDHLERFYNSIDSIEPLISTLIHKSRQICVNGHHLIIIFTFPISETLVQLNKSFSDLGYQRNAIQIFNLSER